MRRWGARQGPLTTHGSRQRRNHWWNVGLKPMFHNHKTPRTATIAHVGGRIVRANDGRTNSAAAMSTMKMPPGLNESDWVRWPCTAADTARDIPQNGHGMPVVARSGQAVGMCAIG